MRTISSTLLTAQQNTKATPHIHIIINAVDYSSRLLRLEHTEEPYRDTAIIILRNNDRLFDGLDLRGYKFRIGYGHTTAATPATWAATTAYVVGDSVQPVTPNGNRYYCTVAGTSGASQPTWPTIGNTVVDGTVTWEYGGDDGDEYSYSADLWIKGQLLLSRQGESICLLSCGGHWEYLREQRMMSYGSAPFWTNTWNATQTVYALIEIFIETVYSWTLNAAPGTDDGILTTFAPVFTINSTPQKVESTAMILFDLLSMTKCYMRVKANSVFEIVYPQAADAANETYYSNQVPYFLEYTERKNLLIPNSIVVYANILDAEAPGYASLITGTASDTAQIAKYVEVKDPNYAPATTTQANADNRASAILTRVKTELVDGKLFIPHDARVELYDKVAVYDARGY